MATHRATETTDSIRAYTGTCPECEQFQVSTSVQKEEYVYGTGESAIRLNVEIPVHRCNHCELQFTDWQAAEIKQNALCKHFGVLNPTQITQLRKKHGMSRIAFAKVTGIGEASMSRWEKGINIQNVAHDRFLRLLNDPSVLNRLRRTVKSIEVQRQGTPAEIIPFPNLKNQTKLEQEKRSFNLR